jgi:hypothetical protein
MEEMREKLCKLSSCHEVFNAIWECTTTMQTKLITTMWVLWSKRNAVNAGERKTPADKMSYQILRHINEFQEFCTNKNDKPVEKLEYWKRPADSYLKINIDGAFIQQTQSGGWGFIIRDTDGDHVGLGAWYIAAISEASLMEAQACLHAIQYAISAGIQKVKIETDCLTLKTALSSKAYDDA